MADYFKELLDLELGSGRLDPASGSARRLEACRERVSAALDQGLAEEWAALEDEARYFQWLSCFRHGFRLALSLLLDPRILHS